MTRPLAEPADSREHRVLLVEDEPIVRLELAETLRAAGYRVVECATAWEAAEILAAGQPVDALVTDVRTPGPIDGLELARRARARDAAMPIVVISGHLDPREAQDADIFLGKPAPSVEVRAALKRLIGDAGSQR
jgi:CheY-like chemotaxis protein